MHPASNSPTPTTLTLSGVFDDAVFQCLPPQTRQVVLTPRLRRVFWVDWYPERYEFEALAEYGETEDDEGLCVITTTLTPTTMVHIVPAEHWRRAGYRVLAALACLWTLAPWTKRCVRR